MTKTSDGRSWWPNPLPRAARLWPRVPRLVQRRREIASDFRNVLIGCTEPSFRPGTTIGPFFPGHFYSPIPSAEQIGQRLERLGDRSSCAPSVDLRVDQQLEMLRRLSPFIADAPFGKTAEDAATRGHRYYFDAGFFGVADCLVLQAMLRAEPPRQVIEVGSGVSSAAMLDTDELFLERSTRFTFIDPNPERLHGFLRGRDRHDDTIDIHEAPVQDIPRGVFDGLEAGDILFIDSSHVVSCGSDVQYLFLDVVPQLRSGVRVHIHDVLWPFEYPPEWLARGWYWNEAYLTNALLIGNDRLQIDLFADYLWHAHRESLRGLAPRWYHTTDGGGGSLWLRVA